MTTTDDWQRWAPLGQCRGMAMLLRILMARYGPLVIARDEFERAQAAKADGATKPMMKIDPASDALLFDMRPRGAEQ